MFKALLFSRFKSLYYTTFRAGKRRNSPVLAVLLGALMIYVIGVFAFLMGGIFFLLASNDCAPRLYLALVGVISTLFAVFGSILYTKNQLFEAKDNELLLSMPIPPAAILGSRLGLILILTYIFEGIVFVPAGIVYLLNYGASAPGILFYCLGCLVMPAIAIAICCLLAWVIAWIESKLPVKKYASLVLMIAFFAAYFYVIGKIEVIGTFFIGHLAHIDQIIRTWFYPFYAFGAGLTGSPLLLIAYLALSALIFFAVWEILSKTYIGIVTAEKGRKRKAYAGKAAKVRSAFSANRHRELIHFLNNPMYILNALTGSILLLIGAVALAIKISDVRPLFTYFPDLWGVFATAALVVLTLMNLVSASSISLEGKNLWIIRSAPVSSQTVLRSKMMNHVWAAEPVILIAWLILQFLLPLTLADRVMMLVVATLANFYIAYGGIVCNLLLPKMEWISETAVVKQGASVMVAMLASGVLMAVPLLPSALLIFIGGQGAWVYYLIHIVYFALALFGMDRWICKFGVRRFENL